MALTVDPSRPPVTSTPVVSSPDGLIKAVLDTTWAGVLLRANFSSKAYVPRKITFRRTDGTPVRGGDGVPSPGGYATTYDHEVGLGVAAAWYAVDDQGNTSQSVGVTLPAPATGVDSPSTWIKSIDRPDLSVQVPIDSWPTFGYDSDAEAVRIAGRTNSVVSYDVMSAIPTQAKFFISGNPLSDQFLDCIAAGIVLIQTAPVFHRPSFYALVSAATREDRARMEQGIYTWTTTLIPVDRPPTTGQSARIPGHSFTDRKNRFPLFNDVPAQPFSAGQGAVGY